jgi:STE24 endopeptidase
MSVPADRLTRNPLRLGGPWVGRWVGLLVPLAWAAGAAVLITRVGEQMILRAACGFHVPSPAQAASLKPAWSAALGVTGTAAGDVELYVQTARAPNAYAAGGRGVAVTSRVVEDHATGRLPEGQLVAVLVHELGHHATGATRPMLLLTWLTAPWRATASVLAGLASTLAGRHPRQGLSVVVLAGLAVAEFRALQQGQWMAGGVLVVVGLTAVLVPLANAGISRRSEYAADRFATDHGLAIELAAALRVLDDGKRAPGGWSRLLSTHPTAEQRIRALQTTTAGQRPDGDCDRHADVHIAGVAERLLRAGVSSRELEQ